MHDGGRVVLAAQSPRSFLGSSVERRTTARTLSGGASSGLPRFSVLTLGRALQGPSLLSYIQIFERPAVLSRNLPVV